MSDKFKNNQDPLISKEPIDSDISNSSEFTIMFNQKPSIQIEIKVLDEMGLDLGNSDEWAQYLFGLIRDKINAHVKPFQWMN